MTHRRSQSYGIRRVGVVVLLALLLGCVPTAGDPGEDAPLVDRLQAGGFTLYLRHTETTAPGVDELATLGDCDAQRELSDDGRRDAVEIGEALRVLDVPIGEVRTSPFCRVVETAELLAVGSVEVDDALLSLATMELEGVAERDRTAAAAARLLAEVPADGTNRVLVGQFSNLRPVAGVALEEGETAVFLPDGDGWELIDRVSPQDWQALAADALDRD